MTEIKASGDLQYIPVHYIHLAYTVCVFTDFMASSSPIWLLAETYIMLWGYH